MTTQAPSERARARRPERPYLDDLAELYDEFIGAMDHKESPTRTWLMSNLPGGGRIIDIGCGNGRNCRLVADSYAEVLGIDVSPRVLELARTRDNPANVRYEVHDIHEISPDEVGTFDAVFSTNGVFSMGDISAVLPQLRRLVAPGGRLVVLDITRPDEAPDDPDAISSQQSRYPFEVAHTIYQVSGDVERTVAAIRYMLHPRWLEMNRTHVPLTVAQFRAAYAAELPGVSVQPDVVPGLSGAVWQSPAGGDRAGDPR
jgi:ubiquinone/menaquinone biosynthesis C-methylase UbiE